MIGAHLARILDVLETSFEQDAQTVSQAPTLTGQIELRDVSFRYHPNAPYTLRHISVEIKPGQKVALVGRTGSGKSTLAKLFLGLYEPDEGAIFYDNHSLQTLNYQTVRQQCGIVMQDSSLFSGSVRQNILFNNPAGSLEDAVQAAKLAAIHAEIEQMPMSYDTLIAENGSALSGGQRQRLALARAFAQRPSILVLDEATSHLDTITEAHVEQQLSALACTRIVIAHRLSTVRDADLILALEQGQIVERGTHADLMALGGLYAALVQRQIAEERFASIPAAIEHAAAHNGSISLTAAGCDHRAVQ
jgi:ABC-type bacteriocin/lantibiotic exporter with double-glycine peptidase domain